MPQSIKGTERKALREALMAAFKTYPPLRRMGLDQLDFDLNSRTSEGAGMYTAADELIEAMDEQAGRPGVVRLIEAARAERPENPALREVEQKLMHTANPLGDVHASASIAPQVSTRAGLERVIVEAAGFPDFNEVIGKLGMAEYKVCLVGYRLPDGRQVYGTGFLVAKDLVMTNDHVISPARDAQMAGSEIDLVFGYRSKEARTSRHRLTSVNWLAACDNGLDYAILRVDGTPGEEPLVANGTRHRGYFKLVAEPPSDNEPLLILQHPYDKLDGSPSTLRLTIGFTCPRAPGQPAHVLRHTANTSEGSSGSGVFTGRMDLIALHNWGGTKHNEAILAGAIRDHLDATGKKDLLD